MNSADRNALDSSLEFDQRVAAVVHVRWQCLAASTEVNIIADSALVTNASDAAWIGLVKAEWAIAVDEGVALLAGEGLGDGLVDWNEAMARVDLVHLLDAAFTVVPVRAVEALMADTVNILVLD